MGAEKSEKGCAELTNMMASAITAEPTARSTHFSPNAIFREDESFGFILTNAMPGNQSTAVFPIPLVPTCTKMQNEKKFPSILSFPGINFSLCTG